LFQPSANSFNFIMIRYYFYQFYHGKILYTSLNLADWSVGLRSWNYAPQNDRNDVTWPLYVSAVNLYFSAIVILCGMAP